MGLLSRWWTRDRGASDGAPVGELPRAWLPLGRGVVLRVAGHRFAQYRLARPGAVAWGLWHLCEDGTVGAMAAGPYDWDVTLEEGLVAAGLPARDAAEAVPSGSVPAPERLELADIA